MLKYCELGRPTAQGFQFPASGWVFPDGCVESPSLGRHVPHGGQCEGQSGGFELALELNSMGTKFRFFAAV